MMVFHGAIDLKQRKPCKLDFSDFCLKTYLHILVNWFFRYHSADIHHMTMKFGSEVYIYIRFNIF